MSQMTLVPDFVGAGHIYHIENVKTKRKQKQSFKENQILDTKWATPI